MISITDILNKRNAKRAFRFIVGNPRQMIVLSFMCVTLWYKYSKKVEEKTIKWTNQSDAIFRKLKPSGSIEMIVNDQLIDISLTNYIIPQSHDEEGVDADIDRECESQMHSHFKAILRDKINSGTTIKVVFNKDTEKDVEPNTVNPGFHSQVMIDDKNLSDILMQEKILCSIPEIKNSKTGSCDWCTIRNKAGFQHIES